VEGYGSLVLPASPGKTYLGHDVDCLGERAESFSWAWNQRVLGRLRLCMLKGVVSCLWGSREGFDTS